MKHLIITLGLFFSVVEVAVASEQCDQMVSELESAMTPIENDFRKASNIEKSVEDIYWAAESRSEVRKAIGWIKQAISLFTTIKRNLEHPWSLTERYVQNGCLFTARYMEAEKRFDKVFQPIDDKIDNSKYRLGNLESLLRDL